MMASKIQFLAAVILVSFSLAAQAQDSPYQWILNMTSKEKNVRKDAAQQLLQLNNAALAPAMVDAIFYMPRTARGEMIDLLQKITGEKFGDTYYDWVEYIGKRSDLMSPLGYPRFKATLLSMIDERYKKILYTGVPFKIRLEEIVWGGVPLDGIPPIDAPVLISASEAKLKNDEKVFGITVKGESRAYPLRYLSWHEMLNDRIAGEPITVSY